MIGDVDMPEQDNKDKTILIHSKQGSNKGTVSIDDLIREKQNNKKDGDD